MARIPISKVYVVLLVAFVMLSSMDVRAHGREVIEQFITGGIYRYDGLYGAKREGGESVSLDGSVLGIHDISAFMVHTGRGAIHTDVEVLASSVPRVTYTLEVRAKTLEQAKSHAQKVKISERFDDSSLILHIDDATVRDGDVHEIRVSVKAHIPADVPVVIEVARGDLSVKSREAAVTAKTGWGKVHVSDVRGSVTARATMSSLFEQIASDLTLQVMGCQAVVRDVLGNMELNAFGSTVLIESLGGHLVGDTINATSVIARDVGGKIDVHTTFGGFDARHIEGDVVVESQGTEVNIEYPRGSVSINARLARVQLLLDESVGHNISVQARLGEVVSTLPLQVERGQALTKASGITGDGKHTLTVNSDAATVVIRAE